MKKFPSIMLIDDDEYDLFLHEKFIKSITTSENISKFEFADDALAYLTEAEFSRWPEVILLDIYMPVTNGFEFLKKYEKLPLAKRKDVKIIMVSSTLDLADIKKAEDNPLVLAFMAKPLRIGSLISLLDLEEDE